MHLVENKKIITLLFLMSLITIIVCAGLGRYTISIVDIIKAIIGISTSKKINLVLFQIRFPRILAAFLIGSALSVSGAIYQGIFHNPLVSPDVLGSSAGSAFGAALALLLGFSAFGVSAISFFFGLIVVVLVLSLSKAIKMDTTLSLVLCGIMLGSLFGSGTSFIKLIADPKDQLPSITYWLMGSLNNITPDTLKLILLPIIVCILILYALRWRINLLTLSDIEAKSMGINTSRLRTIAIILSTLLTSVSVSVSGLIGWVGLVVPHLARLLVGYDYRDLIPASALIGGIFLVLVDTLSRTLLAVEIPLGILTSIIGAPFFLYLIYKRGGKKL